MEMPKKTLIVIGLFALMLTTSGCSKCDTPSWFWTCSAPAKAR
jgi:hypothetical protein